jgi:hypothetical protein
MAKAEPKATEIYELQSRLEVLEKENEVLKRFVAKADRIIASLEDIGKVYGTYRGSDNRLVPAVITAAFPKAGTVDIFVFDNSYSGGNYQLTGIYLGPGKGEMSPYLATELAEDSADEFVMAT